MALLHPFEGTEAKAKKPINEELTDLKYKENIEDLANQIDAISGGSGGAIDTGKIAEVQVGGETNEARFWQRRYSIHQSMLAANDENPTGFDPEGKQIRNTLVQFLQSNDTGITYTTPNACYLGNVIIMNKDSKISFIVKKGVNFFGVSHQMLSTLSNRVEVLIDGLTPSAIGLEDENGNASPDFFTTNSSQGYYQTTEYFYGLDGEEHVITLLNNDSGSNTTRLDSVIVGYRSNDYALDNTVKINAGKANVRGTIVEFPETELTFDQSKNGHTGAIVCSNGGTLKKVDGESPAMTQVRAEEAVAFSSAVTSLPVKNSYYFPDNGICLLSTPYGNHHLFSYSSKDEALIQAHSLDAVLWQSQPTEDFTPLTGFTGGVAAATGDLNINYWGTAPILIDDTNNRIDFSITIDGLTTTHSATIVNGRYAADIMPLEKAVRAAMQAVKPLSGEYKLKYNNKSQLWTLYVEDVEVEAFSLLFGTGTNIATSVHPVLGFTGFDKTSAFSYVSEEEKIHLSCRTLEAEDVYMYANDPRIKYSTTTSTSGAAQDLEDRLAMGFIREQDGTSIIQIFPDSDCSGLQLDFMLHNNSSMMTVQIDNGQVLYLNQLDYIYHTGAVTRSALVSSYISFPRGSRTITIRNETSSQFELDDNTNLFFFAGCRQYFTKPAYEALSSSEAVVKTFDVSPISLYATMYGHNGGAIYSPTVTDNVNTITESGSWSASGWAQFNNNNRQTLSNGAYVDISFTLQGNGGGFFLRTLIRSSDGTQKAGMFLSQSPINESTDRIQNWHGLWSTEIYDVSPLMILGLPAGTYTIRLKNEYANRFTHQGFGIIDTVAPEANNNTMQDVTGTGQTLTYPIHTVKYAYLRDSMDRVPSWLERSGYKEGRGNPVHYSCDTLGYSNHDDSGSVITNHDQYYAHSSLESILGAHIGFMQFCKSYSASFAAFASTSAIVQAFIDGVATLNNVDTRVQTKGGTAPSATRESQSILMNKDFFLACAFSTGDTFTVNDTRGIRVGQTVILEDGSSTEKAVIASIAVGVSFTVKKARASVVDANVNKVSFSGFHALKLVQGQAVGMYLDGFHYEPLNLLPSRALVRAAQEFKYEHVTVVHRSIGSGGDAYYPVHSDGVIGNWNTSSIQVIGNDVAYRISQDLKNITCSDLDLKITSTRLVPVLNEEERF